MKNVVISAVSGALGVVVGYVGTAHLISSSFEPAQNVIVGPFRYSGPGSYIAHNTRIGTDKLDTCTAEGATIQLIDKVGEEYIVTIVSSASFSFENKCLHGDLVALSSYQWHSAVENYHKQLDAEEREKVLVDFASRL